MIDDSPVPLVRHFSAVPRSESDADEQEVRAFLGFAVKSWAEIDRGYRSVILAEAGAGKTFEMLARAKSLERQGHPAFFIRIENLNENFEQAFEVGSVESLERWLGSQDEAWFYLDSVDEARLDNPTTFEKAIRGFRAKIEDAQLRAHICVSSRPYAWRPKSDPELIQRHLPFTKPKTERTGEDWESIEPTDRSEDALQVYFLQPLDEEGIRLFANHRSTPKVERLIQDLARSNLMALAGRPFDLQGILAKWTADSSLGGRSELLRHNIKLRLREIDRDRAMRQPLNQHKALDGARALAAAVVLTGQAGIQIPENVHERSGIDAEAVLADWGPDEVQTLLERAIFDDVIYGAVRFRHREVRELLAADWFADLLKRGHSRHAIETLIFREQYGQDFVAPRLRVVLPWLILEDKPIRARALDLYPEVAIEGGDPALLPLPERRRILGDVVERIVRDEDVGGARDNGSIARIAQPDLAAETRALIARHGDNDDAAFFLGRLVWQGEMSDCVPPLLDLAVDSARGIYARIAATRAVMSCGTGGQKLTLWNRLLATEQIPRRLLAELVEDVDADAASVPLVLASMDRLPPYDRFEATGLTQALDGYIERLPEPVNANADQPLPMLVASLGAILRRRPFIEWRECQISEEFAWLLGPAIHAVEKLVSARADAAMEDPALAIMINAPAARGWRDHGIDHHKDRLRDLVPAWPELNDALFWENIRAERTRLEDDGKRLDDDWRVQWPDHYWSFGPDSFSRALDWLNARDLEDDRLVALCLAFRVYAQAEKPAEWLDRLCASVTGNAVLTARLGELLNRTKSEEVRRWERREAEHQRRLERQQQEQEQRRLDWIVRLKADPDSVRSPPGVRLGELSPDQYWLLREIEGDHLRTNRAQGAAWRSLIDDFGEDVAVAYRDAAKAHWRHCRPGLRSEGAETNWIPYSLVFAMAGLEIEAHEMQEFPAHLCESEVRLALRYIIWELNRFPGWLATMHRARPQAVMEAVQTELFWELANAEADRPKLQMLHDLAHYAPWLHSALVEPLLAWLRANDPSSDNALRHTLRILKSGRLNSVELAALAKTKAAHEGSGEHRPFWYAMWVDAEPNTGVDAVAVWLAGLDPEAGSQAAQIFITALMASRDGGDSGPDIGNFRTPRHLKSLYVLMHDYIRTNEDINRAGGGVYSPELRDDAQDARNTLFTLLSDIPGKEAFVALTELIEDHPDPRHRPWMAKRAYDRAQADGDLEPWTAEQVHEFGANLTRTPATQRQLFDLTVARVTDLKNWLAHGDHSPYRTWRNVDSEGEMRNLITGELNRGWGNTLTAAQEVELANGQRIDILLQNQNVRPPVPIELKVLDNGWSGPKLCERLHNQLVGDYLREGTERCGLMLLVWRGTKPGRRWRIGGQLVGLSRLRDALIDYWAGVSNSFPSVAAVEVVVIDLTLRAIKSGQERGR